MRLLDLFLVSLPLSYALPAQDATAETAPPTPAFLKIAKQETVAPKMGKAGAKRVKLWYGPLTVMSGAYRAKHRDPYALDPQGNTFNTFAQSFNKKPISILDATVAILDNKGKAIPSGSTIYDHHAVFMSLNTSSPAVYKCPNDVGSPDGSKPSQASMFAASAEEGGITNYAIKGSSFDTGYHMTPNPTIRTLIELINYTNKTQTAYIALEVEYVERMTEYTSISQSFSVTQCNKTADGVGVRPPPGQKKWTSTSPVVTITKDGYMTGLRGHVHDGGVDLKVIVNKKTLCDSVAYYGGQGVPKTSIRAMKICDGPFKVKKGDTLQVISSYDLVKHPARHDSMGGMGGMDMDAEEMGIGVFAFATKA